MILEMEFDKISDINTPFQSWPKNQFELENDTDFDFRKEILQLNPPKMAFPWYT